jgi:aminoglycoside phosphotransferase (APT) family kinase protein
MTPRSIPADPAERVRAAVAMDLGRPVTVERLGSGGDHQAWLVVVAGEEWIVRVALQPSTDDEAAGASSDAGLCELTEILRRSLPDDLSAWVPEHRLIGPDQWVAHRFVPGRPLQDLVAADAATIVGDVRHLGSRLGELLVAVGRVDAAPDVPVDETDPTEWLAEVDSMAVALADLIGPERRARVRRFATVPFSAPGWEHLTLCHNDLGAEHVIIDDVTGSVSGVIDWSDVAVSDPAADLGRILRDLGDDAASAALAAMPEPCRAGRAERARWYARVLIVEDLDFAARERPDLVAGKLDAFDRLYRSVPGVGG